MNTLLYDLSRNMAKIHLPLLKLRYSNYKVSMRTMSSSKK